jgi:hypothetical protein
VATAVGRDHRVPDGLQRDGQVLFIAPKRLFGIPAIGDIGVRAQHAERLPACQALDDAPDGEDPSPAAVGRALAELHPVLGGLAVDVVPVRARHRFAIVGVQALDPRGVRLPERGGIVAEHRGVLRRHDRVTGLHVEVVETLIGRPKGEA